jgi:hypothetical protein
LVLGQAHIVKKFNTDTGACLKVPYPPAEQGGIKKGMNLPALEGKGNLIVRMRPAGIRWRRRKNSRYNAYCREWPPIFYPRLTPALRRDLVFPLYMVYADKNSTIYTANSIPAGDRVFCCSRGFRSLLHFVDFLLRASLTPLHAKNPDYRAPLGVCKVKNRLIGDF